MRDWSAEMKGWWWRWWYSPDESRIRLRAALNENYVINMPPLRKSSSSFGFLRRTIKLKSFPSSLFTLKTKRSSPLMHTPPVPFFWLGSLISRHLNSHHSSRWPIPILTPSNPSSHWEGGRNNQDRSLVHHRTHTEDSEWRKRAVELHLSLASLESTP